VSEGIENTHTQRDKRYKEYIGKHQPGKKDCEFVFIRDISKPGRHDFNDPGRKQYASNRDQHKDDGEECKGNTCKLNSLFFDLLRYPVKTGIKAMVREPSANRRRRRLGILKATKKASVAGPAPKNPAITMPRIKPNTLLSRVASPTTHAAFTTRVFSASFCGIKSLVLLIFPPCTHR